MKRLLPLLALFAALAPSLAAQDRAPELLFEAAQCLVNDSHHWVDASGQKELHLGYLEDNKNYLKEKYIYVLVFSTPQRDRGQVFDISHRQDGHNHVYLVENKASFIVTKKGVEFPDPPLGGAWTQSQLSQAIQQIVKRKWYEAQMKYLVKPSSHLQCESSFDK